MARPYFLDFALACYANLAIEMYVKLKVITSINQNTPSPRIMRISILFTPLKTPRISGLKYQIIKPPFLS